MRDFQVETEWSLMMKATYISSSIRDQYLLETNHLVGMIIYRNKNSLLRVVPKIGRMYCYCERYAYMHCHKLPLFLQKCIKQLRIFVKSCVRVVFAGERTWGFHYELPLCFGWRIKVVRRLLVSWPPQHSNTIYVAQSVQYKIQCTVTDETTAQQHRVISIHVCQYTCLIIKCNQSFLYSFSDPES